MSQLITREYNGTAFLFREDGYFNMTHAAEAFGKRMDNFTRLKGTTEYLEALAVSMGKLPQISGSLRGSLSIADTITRMGVIKMALVDVVQGRNGGTWGHPKLAVFFARWLDIRFAVFCDMVIDDILNKKAELSITKPEESAVMALPKSFSDALRLAADLQDQLAAAQVQTQQLQVDNERLQPAATIGTAVGSLKHMSVMDFARKLEGVDLTQVQKTLGTMNYLYRRNGCWAVYAKYNGKLFSEKAAPDGRSVVVILPAGQQLLTNLYLNGDLKMRKGCAPVVGGQ